MWCGKKEVTLAQVGVFFGIRAVASMIVRTLSRIFTIPELQVLSLEKWVLKQQQHIYLLILLVGKEIEPDIVCYLY